MPTVGAFVAAALALLSLVGWTLGLPGLTTLGSGLVSMKPNTAICIFLLSVALACRHREATSRRGAPLATATAATAFGIGAATLFQYGAGIDLGIDELLFTDVPAPVATSHAGRMAPFSALAFVLLALAVLASRRTTVWLMFSLALTAGALGSLSLLGYAYGVEELYQIGVTTALSVHTSLAVTVVACGILFVRRDTGWLSLVVGPGLAGGLTRRLLPVVVGAPVVIGYVITRAVHVGVVNTSIGVALFTLSSAGLLSSVVLWNARALDRMDREREQVETDLRHREEHNRLILDSALDSVISIDSDGVITDWNTQATRDFGWARDDIVGRRLDETIIPEDLRQAHRDGLERHLESGATSVVNRRVEMRAMRRDGSEFPVELAITRVVQRGVLGFNAFVRDLRQLRASELARRHLSAIIESSDEAITSHRLDGVITSWNPGAQRLYGYSATEAVGQNVSMLVPDDLREALRLRLESIREGQRVASQNTRRIRHDGTLVDVAETISPVLDGSGAVVGSSTISRDIGERLAAEKRFELAVEASLNAMLLIDEGGSIVMANSEAGRMFGYSRAELFGKSVELLVPLAWRGTHPELRRRYLESPHVRRMGAGRELFAMHRDGSEFPVEVGLNPIQTPTGTLVLSAVVDITERRRLEALRAAHEHELGQRSEQLERSNVELRRSNEELDGFAYVASHDLKAPLRAIDNLSSWLERDLAEVLTEDTKRQIDLLRGRVKRMELLVDGLLQYSRAGRRPGELRRVVVEDMLKSIISLLAPPPGFEFELGSQLPTLETYEVPLALVFRNLLGNAVKHHDLDHGRIRVESLDAGEMYEFSVLDDGPGIPAKYHAKAFEVFQTLRPRDEVEGSGLGLALVKKVVESQSGSVRIEADDGRGLRIRFTWPKTIGRT